ncbi:Kinesin-like protein KIN-14J [Sesamum angolense]|uniref:Kinesin-like protein KIN-14J n=1 Tax=Sesamum angolense TaxID=2727404 RepID=A0AAE1W9K3_9LAMI|nr:Kinesin-like protein KIN-14J [Sesamum angolense]
MDPQSEVRVSENRELDGLSEVRNGNVSGRIEAFNGLAEGHNFSGVLKSKRVHHADVPALKISELTKLGNLESASSHSLFSTVNRILDECIEKSNQDIPQRVASVLKLVVQEIEQRVTKQADNMRKQSNMYKSREDRYHTKIRALETLATGTTEENEVVMNQLQQMKIQKTKIEEKKKLEEQDLIKLRKEKVICESKILSLTEELNLAKKSYEENLFHLKAKAEETKDKLQKKILELESLLTDSRKKTKELEDFSESKFLRWKRKEQKYKHFIDSQFGSLQELRLASESIKQEVSKINNTFAEEFYHFGFNLQGLIDAAQNYHSVLEENRKLYNEVQDLKEDVFRDTQPLIRSVLDGYNVCIFAYGQTGSGKTYTMSGPNASSVADWGVNYRALNDLFNISQKRHGSIAYEIGVQMVEIYNEQVRDLLCPDSSQKRYPSELLC